MLKNVLQKQKTNEKTKCIRCKQRNATKEDQMCDSCRYLITIEGILKSRND